jgi:outer membrane protein assembly factor BamB
MKPEESHWMWSRAFKRWALWLAGVIAFFASGAAIVRADAEPDPIEGTWLGTITAPQGPATIGFRFERAAGRLVYALHFPVMNAYGVKFGAPVTREGDTYTEPVFTSRLRLTGDTLTGTFGPGRLPVELRRGGFFEPAPAPPTFPPAPAPLWTHALGSPTWASPVVVDGIVFVGASNGQFHAVRASDGSEVWTWSGPNRVDGRAVVSGDAVFLVDGRIELVCLSRADGRLRWRFPLHDEGLAGKPVPDNPTFNRRTATPLVLDGIVHVGSSDGGLYAIDATAGSIRWRHEAGAPVFSGVGQADADTLTFGTMDGAVVLLDRRTQKETLRAKVGGAVVTTPVVAGDRIIVGGRDYFLYGLDRRDGSVAWRFSYWFSWIESTGALRDGVFYVGASDYRRVTTFDPATGREHWATDVRGLAWGTPVVTDDSVFIGTVAQNIPGTAIEHTGGIMALDRRTGEVRWQLLATPAEVNQFGGYAGTLGCDGERLFAAGFDGNLIALPVR